jgi:hypothetical protein
MLSAISGERGRLARSFRRPRRKAPKGVSREARDIAGEMLSQEAAHATFRYGHGDHRNKLVMQNIRVSRAPLEKGAESKARKRPHLPCAWHFAFYHLVQRE